MDKRTLLFVVALSLTLFGMNIFFQNQNTEKKKEWVLQQEASQQKKQSKQKLEIQQRIAGLDELPLIRLYSDHAQEHFLTAAVQNKNLLMTLSSSDSLPEKAYAKTSDESYAKEYLLAYHHNGVAIYQEIGTTGKLKVAQLSDFGKFDLQLVSFNSSDRLYPVMITLGEYRDGHFSLPLGNLETKENKNENKFHSIALYHTPEGYLPAALFNDDSESLTFFQDVNDLSKMIQLTNQVASMKKSSSKEQYYVLENDYQQLVFSNVGAALAEINLPFESEKNKKSVVREIEFDRDMVKNHPYNAHFPSHSYYTPSAQPEDAPIFHEKGILGGYYPLIRRDLIEKNEERSIKVTPQYYALNIVSEYPEMATLVYQVKSFTKNSISFEASQGHRRIIKTFTLGQSDSEGPYCVHLDIKIEGESRGLWLTSGVPEVELISGSPAPTLKYRITRNNNPEVEKIDLPSNALTVTSVYPDWICNSNGFLGTIIDSLKVIEPGYRVQQVSGTTVPTRLIEIGQEFDRFKASAMPGYMTLLPLKSQDGAMQFRFFAGPFDSDILKQIDAQYSQVETGYNPDYIACQTAHGWFTFISEPFSKFLLILMKFFYFVTHSWVASIVLLTISLRIMLYPLNAWSTKSMVKMQQIAPEIAHIQEKYKKDPKRAQMEVLNLYRTKGVNPVSGCLPMLIQMPFLVGMFDLLKSSFALRGAPFIPGWIDDLTAPDVLFRWTQPIPFFGNEFHLLPILLGLVMFAQQRLMSTAPKDPSQMNDQQRQQKAMGTMMSVVFMVMFYNFPSGLNIYWLSSMLLGMLQQWMTTRRMNRAVQSVVMTGTAGKKK